MSVYTDYPVSISEKLNHVPGCPWLRRSAAVCTCKRPDVVITDSSGNAIRGFSRLGYEVALPAEDVNDDRR